MLEAAGSRARVAATLDRFPAIVWLAALSGAARSVEVAARRMLGQPARRRCADRDLLERQILPAFAGDGAVTRVLFCGCARYTRDYGALFDGAKYWTIDPNPRSRRFGARLHLVDRLECLERHALAAFDLIVCNGVLGWGLSTLPQAEAAFDACYAALARGGYLLLGWNDVAPRNRVRPEAIGALARFEHVRYSRFGPRIRVSGWHRHVFDFYRKPRSDPSSGRQ